MPLKDILQRFKEKALLEDFAVGNFCRDTKMGYTAFYEKIVHSFGFSPCHLAENYRLEESLRLMEEDNRLLKDIALQAGYANYHTFHHAVKRRLGESPQQIKLKLENGAESGRIIEELLSRLWNPPRPKRVHK